MCAHRDVLLCQVELSVTRDANKDFIFDRCRCVTPHEHVRRHSGHTCPLSQSTLQSSKAISRLHPRPFPCNRLDRHRRFRSCCSAPQYITTNAQPHQRSTLPISPPRTTVLHALLRQISSDRFPDHHLNKMHPRAIISDLHYR